MTDCGFRPGERVEVVSRLRPGRVVALAVITAIGTDTETRTPLIMVRYETGRYPGESEDLHWALARQVLRHP